MWQNWVTGILGIWLIISSFIPALRCLPNLLVVGIVVAALGLWLALKPPKKASPSMNELNELGLKKVKAPGEEKK